MTSLTLRLRLLLGYGYLVAMLLLATGSALLGFLHLSETVDVILEENFASVRAAMDMLGALERQDSATLVALIEGRADVPQMADHEAVFLEALETAEGNVTEEAEIPVLEELRQGFRQYQQARSALLAARPEQPLRAYNREVFPVFSEVKGSVLELLDVNHRAMIEADRETRESAVRNGAWLGVLVVVALLSLVFLSRALQQHVLHRLDELRQQMGSIVGGQHQRRLRDHHRDELGAIARHFNELLDQVQQLEGRLRGRLGQERQAVLGLVRQLGGDAAVYDLSGRLLAAAGDDAARPYGGGRLVPELREWVVEGEGRRRVREGSPGEPAAELEVEGTPVRLDLLWAGPGRPVAWLLRTADG